MSSSGEETQSRAGENLKGALSAMGNAATGTVKVAAKALDETVKVVDKTVDATGKVVGTTVDVTGQTVVDAVETAGVVAEAALGVTRKAATSTREIAETAMQTASNVTKSAGEITSTATNTASKLTTTTARYATQTANTAANIAIRAQKDAQVILGSAGEVATSAANAASKLSQTGFKATGEVGAAVLEATSETTVKGIDLVKTTLATTADLTTEAVNSTIKGVNNMFTIISNAGARYTAAVKASQGAKQGATNAMAKATIALTNEVKAQLRTTLYEFSRDFNTSLIGFKSTQVESLAVLHAILRNEYCLGRMAGFKRALTKKCPPKMNSQNVSKQLEIFMNMNERDSKIIIAKVASIFKQFEVNNINLINFSKFDAEATINTFNGNMDAMMNQLASFTTKINEIYQKTIDWVQSMIDKRTAFMLNSLGNKIEPVNTQPANGHNNQQPLIAMGGKRRNRTLRRQKTKRTLRKRTNRK